MTTLGPLCLVVPLLAAAGVAAAGGALPRAASPVLALAATLAVAVLCAVLVHRAAPGPLVTWLGGWHPRGRVAIGIDLAADDVGAGMALFIALLTAVALLVSVRVVSSANYHFDALVLVFLAGAAGFCLTGDLFDMFVSFELFSVAAYVLVGFEIDERAPLEGALSFAVTNTAGSILLLFAISLLYGETGALNLAQMGVALHGHAPDGLVVCAFALLLAGFCVKAAIVPFHFWTADAYAVAPTSVCILLAGAMSELGLFAIARTWWTVFDGSLGGHAPSVRTVLVALGIVSALVGGAMCLVQHHLRRMLAFATIAHLGMLLAGIGLLSVPALAGVALFVVGDGLVRAGLFVAVGLIGLRLGSVQEGELYGRGRGLRPLGVLFALGALLIAALPPGGPFLGRALIEHDASQLGYGWVVALMVLASALAGGALLRAAARVFLGWGERPGEDPASEPPDDEDRAAPHPRSPAVVWAPAVALVLAGLAWGLIPGLVPAAGRAAAAFAAGPRYASVVLGGSAPPAPAHVPTPDATAWLLGLLSAALAVGVAALGLWRHRLGLRAPHVARRAIAGMRALHSGRPGDYLAWTALGAATLGGLVAIAVS